MSSQRKPRVGGNPCVAISTKEFDRATGQRVAVEVHTLRKGESVVFAAGPGQVVELKVIVSGTQPAPGTKLMLQVGTDSACTEIACGWCSQEH